MGKPTGFLEIDRKTIPNRAPKERVKDWNEIHEHFDAAKVQKQGARCMDCGTPYCHTGMTLSNMASGCPINNLCLLYTSPSPRDGLLSRMPSSA